MTQDKMFERFEPDGDGAEHTCSVRDDGLNEWSERGHIDGAPVRVYWLLDDDEQPDGDGREGKFDLAHLDRIEGRV